MKRIASIQDISCLGRCSLTVALPVLATMGVECAIIPTAVLSTHTMFPDFTCHDLTGEILPIAHHWQSQQLQLDAIYTGYLASPQQAETVCHTFDLLKGPDTLIVVDPAMADHGKLYPPFRPDFPLEMAKVCSRADVILPNLTEAALLTGTPYLPEPNEAQVKDLLKRLADHLQVRRPVLTGISFTPDRLGAMCYDAQTGDFFHYDNQRIPAHFHGTGDIFSATTVGGLMRGRSLEEALMLAVDFTLACIHCNRNAPASSWYGVEFERALPQLIHMLEAQEGPLC